MTNFKTCCFTPDRGTLTLGNPLFSKSFSNIGEAKAESVTPKSRSLPPTPEPSFP